MSFLSILLLPVCTDLLRPYPGICYFDLPLFFCIRTTIPSLFFSGPALHTCRRRLCYLRNVRYYIFPFLFPVYLTISRSSYFIFSIIYLTFKDVQILLLFFSIGMLSAACVSIGICRYTSIFLTDLLRNI